MGPIRSGSAPSDSSGICLGASRGLPLASRIAAVLARWRTRVRAVGERLRWARHARDLASDGRSLAQLLRLRLCDPSIRTVQVRLRPLGGQSVSVRPGTADLWAIETLLPPVHLPPPEVPAGEVHRIWDLGANIGLTMAHMAQLYPNAQIIGVEVDAENASLCRENTTRCGDRCHVIEAAVWPSDGQVSYDGERGQELGFRVVENAAGPPAMAISLNSLLARSPSEEIIDYVKMDIEGAERVVLKTNTEWASRVRTMKVEIHPPYSVEECVRDLDKLGFATSLEEHPEEGMPAVVAWGSPTGTLRAAGERETGQRFARPTKLPTSRAER